MPDTTLEALFKRDDVLVPTALVVLTALAWFSVLAGAGTGMDPASMSGWWLPLAPAPALGSAWAPLIG